MLSIIVWSAVLLISHLGSFIVIPFLHGALHDRFKVSIPGYSLKWISNPPPYTEVVPQPVTAGRPSSVAECYARSGNDMLGCHPGLYNRFKQIDERMDFRIKESVAEHMANIMELVNSKAGLKNSWTTWFFVTTTVITLGVLVWIKSTPTVASSRVEELQDITEKIIATQNRIPFENVQCQIQNAKDHFNSREAITISNQARMKKELEEIRKEMSDNKAHAMRSQKSNRRELQELKKELKGLKPRPGPVQALGLADRMDRTDREIKSVKEAVQANIASIQQVRSVSSKLQKGVSNIQQSQGRLESDLAQEPALAWRRGLSELETKLRSHASEFNRRLQAVEVLMTEATQHNEEQVKMHRDGLQTFRDEVKVHHLDIQARIANIEKKADGSGTDLTRLEGEITQISSRLDTFIKESEGTIQTLADTSAASSQQIEKRMSELQGNFTHISRITESVQQSVKSQKFINDRQLQRLRIEKNRDDKQVLKDTNEMVAHLKMHNAYFSEVRSRFCDIEEWLDRSSSTAVDPMDFVVFNDPESMGVNQGVASLDLRDLEPMEQ